MQQKQNNFRLPHVSCLQLWKYTFNRLLVALAVFDLLFVVATVPIHTFHVFNYSNWFYAAIYSRSAARSLQYKLKLRSKIYSEETPVRNTRPRGLI